MDQRNSLSRLTAFPCFPGERPKQMLAQTSVHGLSPDAPPPQLIGSGPVPHPRLTRRAQFGAVTAPTSATTTSTAATRLGTTKAVRQAHHSNPHARH
jgi:hypothetical protein